MTAWLLLMLGTLALGMPIGVTLLVTTRRHGCKELLLRCAQVVLHCGSRGWRKGWGINVSRLSILTARLV